MLKTKRLIHFATLIASDIFSGLFRVLEGQTNIIKRTLPSIVRKYHGNL